MAKMVSGTLTLPLDSLPGTLILYLSWGQDLAFGGDEMAEEKVPRTLTRLAP